MFKKIISSGQSGADRAALDVAIKLNIPHGGWASEGELAVDGSMSAKYRLRETRSSSNEVQAELNVVDSDGTLIMTRGPLNRILAYVREAAARHQKPWLYVDLSESDAFHAAFEIESWLLRNNIEVLNVAGPRDGSDSDLYQATKSILEVVSHLMRFGIKLPPYVPFVDFKKRLDPSRLPKEVDDVVELLMSDLTLKDKVKIARLTAEDLQGLSSDLVQTIKTEFRLDSGNEELLRSCKEARGNGDPSAEEAADVIIQCLLSRIRQDYRTRVVK
jgi:hypothetical protein